MRKRCCRIILNQTPTFLHRQDVKCFGDDTCYSLAFGIPAFLMLAATVILVIGKPMYVLKEPQGNILTSVFGSIWVRTKQEKKKSFEDPQCKKRFLFKLFLKVWPVKLADKKKLYCKFLSHNMFTDLVIMMNKRAQSNQ